MRISDWSSDVCSSDLGHHRGQPRWRRRRRHGGRRRPAPFRRDVLAVDAAGAAGRTRDAHVVSGEPLPREQATAIASAFLPPHKVLNRWDYHYIRSKLSTDPLYPGVLRALRGSTAPVMDLGRSEEHTSELQYLLRRQYAVFCLTKKK